MKKIVDVINMSNDRLGRFITNSLNGYWKNHPGQRDYVHGSYHQMANYFWQGAALSQLCSSSNLEDKKKSIAYCFDRARRDRDRRDDHWIRGENRNDRQNYNPSPDKGCNIY